MSGKIDLAENKARMLRGELYYAFQPDLTAERNRAARACQIYNQRAPTATRREQVEMLKEVFPTLPEIPPQAATDDEDEKALSIFPWAEVPIKADYGTRVSIGEGTFVNFGFTALDTCQITIGKRVLFGPNVQLYAASHPLDPAIRNGTAGPESGGPITIGDDCWFGGQVVVLPNVTIGRGATIGAGSVVTKNVPAFTVAAGNPARIVKKITSPWADEYFKEHPEEEWFPAEKGKK